MELVVEHSGRISQEFFLGEGEIVIGRSQGCDLVLAETGVSRQHARIQPGPEGWILRDLGSTNGTLINGQPLPVNRSHVLRLGDQITVGSFVLTVRPGGEDGEEAWEPPERARPHPVLLAAGAVAVILVLIGVVLLLVTVLRPDDQPVTPTVAGPMDQIMTALPVPTGFEEMITSVATLMPSGLPLPILPSNSTATPTPEAGRPRRSGARRVPADLLPSPAPHPAARGTGYKPLP